MGVTWDPESKTWKSDTASDEPAPAVAADPLASVGAPTASPVPGVDTAGSQTAEVADPSNPYDTTPSAGQKLVHDVGSALSAPIHSPMGFLGALSDQVKGVFVNPFVDAAKNPSDIPKQLDPRELQPDTPGFALVPGYKTAFDIQTPEGREYLKENPSQVVLDVAGLIGGGNKPGARLPAAMEKAEAAVTKVGEVLEKTGPGRAVVEKVSSATARARESLPSARSPETAALPASQRQAAQAVQRNVGDLLNDFKAADLTPEEMASLRSSLDQGVPPTDPKLAPLYEHVAEWSDADRARKLERDIPASVKDVVIDQVEATVGPKMAATGLGPEGTVAMFEALRKGEPNPIPEASKAWNHMRLETSRRILTRQRDAKLFEFDAGIPGVEPQVYPWRDYSKLRAAKRMAEKGKVTPEAFRALVEKTTPGKYEPLLQSQKAEFALAQNRLRYEPGFGRSSYDAMAGEGMQTWLDLAEQGVNPVYVPREALKTLTDEARTGRPGYTTSKPASLKGTKGNANYYETDPALMITKSEYDLANQTVVQKAVADIYRHTGGKPYARALEDYMSRGHSQAAAEQLVRDNYRGFKLDGTTSAPQPGQLLIRRDVAAGLKTYIEKTMPSMVDELFGMWMVPTLWMAPMFHVNNVVGGVHMVGLKSPHSLLDYLAYGREAYGMVRRGEMPKEVPFGAGMAPQYTRNFTRESMLQEGGRLAQLWKRIPGHGAVDKSRRFNEFMDSLNRTVVYLAEEGVALRKGLDPITAREAGAKAAQNLMQNWDSMSPIERQIIQRVYPFWGFRKAMLRTIVTYPLDHPLRMQFLASMQRDMEERENLPDEWDNLLAISGEGKDGKRYYLSLKGLDPFADTNDFFTMQGFLQNLHPLGRPILEGFGVDTYRGGSPFFPFYSEPPEVDPNTGQLRKPFDHSVWWDLIPQVGAFAQWARLKDIPPPDENTPDGWLRWMDTYGSTLRITPGISRRSMEEAESKFRKNLQTAASIQAKADAKKSAQQAEPEPAMAGAPSAPSGTVGWDPVTKTWRTQ